ncbi:MAG: M20/M25/M40 family metallo-hydrolase [Methylacidiphilales bacterium]|nr:M20/M25/M40 family metallo-hydrolase [Candidatus Methylacidiphilales bacterium]
MATPKNVVELLQDLVAIPSVNPQGQPGTDHVGEQAIAEYVADFLRALGAEIALEPVEPGRPNVMATFSPEKAKSAPHFAFAPHLDTVSVAGMTIGPFDPAIRDGKLFGRGSTDTKGPMAAALWALREWAQSPARARSQVKWTFLGLMGEEAGNGGALAMAAKKFSSDLTLVLEPTKLGVVTAHKGTFWFEVETTGLACHSSTPEEGRNAIYAMRRIIAAVEEKIIPGLAGETHPRLGPATLNVGTIRGGSKTNIVPDRCRIEVDSRIIPGIDVDAFRRWVEAELRTVVPDVAVHWQRPSLPLSTDESLPWVRRLGTQAKGFVGAPWFSDAAILSAPYCPAVCIGPGSIAQAHTKDEFILLSDLEEGTELFRRWISICEERPHES